MNKTIEDMVNEAINQATYHSAKCDELIEESGLSHALNYSVTIGVRPPQCSLTAKSENANMLRQKALRMLRDSKWWAKQLKKKAIQDFEHEQRCNGLVTNFISDELRQYNMNNK